MRRSLSFIALGLMLVAGTATARPASPELVAELTRLEAERQDAYVSGDAAVLERQFAEEYQHANLRGGVTRRDGELAFYRPGVFALGEGRLSEVEVNDYGDTAVLTGVVAWRDAVYRPAPDVEVDLSGRFRVTRVYVRRDGRWQVAASHASLIPAAVAGPPARAFHAVYVKDAQAAADWYQRVLGLETVNRFDRPAFDQRILAGDRMVVEVIQLKPEPPARPDDQLGYGKAGLVVDDFDGAVARWRAAGERFFGSGRVFWDAALGLHGVQLLDPDGNIVQVYGLSASAPRG